MSNIGEGSSRHHADAVDQRPEAKQCKLTEADLGGPIEDEETAREKLKEVGFDPNNIHEVRDVRYPMALGGGKLIQSVTLQEQVTSRCADISLPEEPRQGTAPTLKMKMG